MTAKKSLIELLWFFLSALFSCVVAYVPFFIFIGNMGLDIHTHETYFILGIFE